MLYSIIPPILIVLSLAGIILFLMKKSKKVATLSIEEIRREEQEKQLTNEAGFFLKLKFKIKNIKWDGIKQSFLAILEKINRRSRIIFLKMESKSSSWSARSRNKRKERITNVIAKTEKPKQMEVGLAAEEQKDIIQKLKEYKLARFTRPEPVQPEKEKAPVAAISGNNGAIKNEDEPARNGSPAKSVTSATDWHSDAGGEKIIKPIISERMVRPNKAEIRDRLEELLIERIAVNPRDIEAYERLGQYYMEIKGWEDAKECFKQVIKLDPTNRNAKYKLKRLETLLSQ